MKKERILTNKELCNMPDGTRVRIKKSVDCHNKYHEGGALSIDYDTMEPGDYPFGIYVKGFGACYNFKAADYELIK